MKSHRQSKNNGISGRADALEAISVIRMLMLVAGTHIRFIKRAFSRKKGKLFSPPPTNNQEKNREEFANFLCVNSKSSS